MQMDHSLKLDLSQKLVMTPQLCQAIAILQLSSLELADMVEQALLENPVLEVDDEPDSVEPTETADRLEEYFDWVDYFNEGQDTRHTSLNLNEKVPLETFMAEGISLQEHLENQLHLALLDDRAKQVGKYLIGCIDDNGYLCGSVEEAATQLTMSVEMVDKVLAILQTFDPIGVAARNLEECLLLQVMNKGIESNLVPSIIKNHLADVAASRYKWIAEQLGCTPHEVQLAVDLIRSLDPKPGRAFGGNQSSYIVPDITVERINGKYMILINEVSGPRLTINPYYRQVVQETNSEARKYVEGHMNAAVWLIKSIEQRRRTLYKVMEAIIELQPGFFDSGPKSLQPMTMKKVADLIEVHESTVSRATANKYVDTTHGLFSLRTFFSNGIQASDGEDVPTSRIKREIQELVLKEDISHPLSDQVMADVLSRQGITISRRTVAKYREELGIASSSRRKRY